MIKRILLIGLVTLGLTSCDDAIEIVQDGELNDEKIFTSTSQMQMFLNETYDKLTIQNDIIVSSILTDEVGLGSAGFSNNTLRYSIFSNNGYALAIWVNHYQAINYANRLLKGAQLVTPVNAADQAKYNNILAQARFIRAFSHFQLLTFFSSDLSSDSALGVMKVDFVPTLQQRISRSTNGEVFQLIESDLQFAADNVTNSTSYNTAAESWKFVNINTVNALRARMYLYRKNYLLAEQYADLVINTSNIPLASCAFTLPANFPSTSSQFVLTGAGTGSASFDSAPSGTNAPAVAVQTALFDMDRHNATTNAPIYRRMWIDTHQGEAIFSLSRPTNAGNLSSQYNTNNSSIGGGALYDMGRTLYNLYTQSLGGGAEDFRRWAFVDRSSTISQTPESATKASEVIVIDKYPGKAGVHSANDLKVFRMSEMYFIKAECRARANDYSGAASLIEAVRQARSYTAGDVPTPVYASLQAAIADILLERRKELAFEGHRYIDLKRLGTEAGVTTTDRYSQDSVNASATNPANIDVTDYRFTLPIPQDELNVNPMTQNTGYSN